MIDNKQRLTYKLFCILGDIESPNDKFEDDKEYRSYIERKVNQRLTFISKEDIILLDGSELWDTNILGIWTILDDIEDCCEKITDIKQFKNMISNLCAKKFDIMNRQKIDNLYRTFGHIR